jgi:hypothetical protein
MNFLYLILFFFLLTIPSYGVESFYVYVKNTTPYILNFKTSLGGSVRPNEQAIFESYSFENISTYVHKIMVKGWIYVKDKPTEKCHVNFKTYTTLNSEMIDNEGKYRMINFATFVLVSEQYGYLICHPVAAEVYPCNEMVANGKIVTIEKAKKAHKKTKKRALQSQPRVYCPVPDESELKFFKNEKRD